MIQHPYDAVIYDCEIRRIIPSPGKLQVEGLEYCNGWSDFDNMGISVIAAYDMATMTPHVFLRDNWDAFMELVSRRDHLIGFNSLRFDDLLCKAAGINVKTTYDLMIESKISCGFGPQQRIQGFSLDKLCFENFGVGKNVDGSQSAPKDWQRKKSGRVINHCCVDMSLTLKLLLKGWQEGLKCPVNHEKAPKKLRTLIEAKFDGAQVSLDFGDIESEALEMQPKPVLTNAQFKNLIELGNLLFGRNDCLTLLDSYCQSCFQEPDLLIENLNKSQASTFSEKLSEMYQSGVRAPKKFSSS